MILDQYVLCLDQVASFYFVSCCRIICFHTSQKERNPRFRESGDSDDEEDDDRKHRR